MSGFHPRSTSFSIRKRIRVLTTLACLLMGCVGIGVLAGGHLVHGGLMLAASVLLLPGTVWGRRHRLHLTQAALASNEPAERRWRRAA